MWYTSLNFFLGWWVCVWWELALMYAIPVFSSMSSDARRLTSPINPNKKNWITPPPIRTSKYLDQHLPPHPSPQTNLCLIIKVYIINYSYCIDYSIHTTT